MDVLQRSRDKFNYIMFEKSASFCAHAKVRRFDCFSKFQARGAHTRTIAKKNQQKSEHNKHVYGCSLPIQCIFVQNFAKNLHKLLSLRFVGSFHIKTGELLKKISLKKRQDDNKRITLNLFREIIQLPF